MEETTTKKRSVEDIEEVLKLAKLNSSDLLPTSQAIYFAQENVHNNNYKFLELDKHLHETIKKGDRIYIKGDEEENVVMCTETKTYNVVETETSNSLLLSKNLKFKANLAGVQDKSISTVVVSGIFYDYLEVIPCKPHLGKLKEILNKTLYRGPELEGDVDSSLLYTYEELLDTIQSSGEELQEALKQMHVVKINDKIRLLDFEYHFRVLSYMLKVIDENAWGLNEIDYDVTLDLLNEIVPVAILNCLFELYTEPSQVVDHQQLYRYKEDDVCRFFAQVLLMHAGKFNFNEFLQAWNDSVPEGMVPQVGMLHGLAIIDTVSTPPVIKYFPENELPEKIMERFAALFLAKEKWTVPEISPYIRPLTTEKVDVNALLAKHARCSTVNNLKYYSAKHAK